MKKKISLLFLTIAMLNSMLLSLGSAMAADEEILTKANTIHKDAKIVDVIDRDNYLMDDGSIWTTSIDGPVHDTMKFKGIAGNPTKTNGMYGWTEDGTVVNWGTITLHTTSQTKTAGVKKIVGDGLVIKSDGTISGVIGDTKDIRNVTDGDKLGGSFALLLSSGDVLYSEGNNSSKIRKLGNVSDAVEIKIGFANIAVLKKNGSVMMLDMLTDDTPFQVGSDITSFVWKRDTQFFLAVHRDGTVWSYNRQKKYASEQLRGLSNVVKIVNTSKEIFAQLKDGSWVEYSDGVVTPFTGPKLTEVTLMPSALEANLGDNIKLNVIEMYSNDYELTRTPAAGEIEVEKPEVAQLVPNQSGVLQAKGIGTTIVTLKADGLSSSFDLSVSNTQKLSGAAQLNGVSYLPIQSVFKTLGATVSVDKQTFTIQLGEQKIVLVVGSASADINGTTVALNGKVQVLNGQTVFPASLLTQLKLGTFKWDSRLQQGELTIDTTTLIIESPETAKIVKAADLGNLTKFIGRSYWVNNFYYAGERFSKVTVKDIDVSRDNLGAKSFEVILQGANGKVYNTFPTSASSLTDMLTDTNQLLTYDPYKKYKWSSAVWNKIKKNQVSLGMNKTQVELSWGHPTSISTKTAKNKGVVEVWVYSNNSLNFGIVTFINGKVIQYTE